MLIIDNQKYYTMQEAADIMGIVPPALITRLSKRPELVTKIDTRDFISAADIKTLIKDIQK